MAIPTHQAQRDGHKICIQLVGPDSSLLLLHMDYAENYSHIQQIMSQQKWFKRLGTVLLVVIAHSWDFDLRKRVSIAHFMITDDLSKGIIQVTYFLEHLVEHYNNKYRAWGQPPIRALVTTSDNCAAQFRSRYHFAWMVDFAEESETITTILSIYLAEYHGKGPADFDAGSFINLYLHSYHS